MHLFLSRMTQTKGVVHTYAAENISLNESSMLKVSTTISYEPLAHAQVLTPVLLSFPLIYKHSSAYQKHDREETITDGSETVDVLDYMMW